MDLEITGDGQTLLGRGDLGHLRNACYFNGPLLGVAPLLVEAPVAQAVPRDYCVLAKFKMIGTLGRKKPLPSTAIPMNGCAAIVTCSFGKGRVVCSSPHLEKPTSARWDGHAETVCRLVAWAAGCNPVQEDAGPPN